MYTNSFAVANNFYKRVKSICSYLYLKVHIDPHFFSKFI